MLAPVSRSTIVGVVFFEVFGDGVFEEIRREYDGVSMVEALYKRYSDSLMLPVILSSCPPLFNLCLPPLANLRTFL